MSRSVKIVEIVNGRESLGGGSLSFLEVGLRRTPERVCAWAGGSGQGNFELAANSDYSSRGPADPRESLLHLDLVAFRGDESSRFTDRSPVVRQQ